MSDIRLSCAFHQHPKTRKVFRRLGAAGPWALVCLFLWARSSRPDGDLTGLSDEDIEIAADWDGDDGQLVATLLACGFLDGDYAERRIHDWEEHQPWSAGSEDRSERAKWRALIKHHGRAAAAERMPDYAAKLAASMTVSDAQEEASDRAADAQHATSMLVAESSMHGPATRSAPSPYPLPYPRSKANHLSVVGAPAVAVAPALGALVAETDEAQPPPAAERRKPAQLTCPAQHIADLWDQTLPELRAPVVWSESRAAAVRARWREMAGHNHWKTQEEGVEWFARLLRKIRESPFLMGRVPSRDKNQKPFALTFDWLFGPKNFLKVIEGQYHEQR